MFKFDLEVAIISGSGVSFFGLLAWAFSAWRRRSGEMGRLIAGFLMAACGLFALLCGVCGLAIMADGGVHIQ